MTRDQIIGGLALMKVLFTDDQQIQEILDGARELLKQDQAG